MSASDFGRRCPADAARLSAGESGQVLSLTRKWMRQLGVRSLDELALAGENLKRSTLYRWFAFNERGIEVRLRVQAVRDIVSALREIGDSAELKSEFDALLKTAEQRTARQAILASECRKRGVSFQRALAAIHGARYRLVPDD